MAISLFADGENGEFCLSDIVFALLDHVPDTQKILNSYSSRLEPSGGFISSTIDSLDKKRIALEKLTTHENSALAPWGHDMAVLLQKRIDYFTKIFSEDDNRFE